MRKHKEKTSPPGPKGPPGPGSTLFVIEQQGVGPAIPPDALDFFIMNIEVTTTEDNQRVKIDGTVNTRVLANPTATNIQISLDYMLKLGTTILTTTDVSGNYNRTSGLIGVNVIQYTWHSNFTFVDVPGPAGTYIYTVSVTESIDRSGVTLIQAVNRGLTATVYPPA